MAFSLKTTGLPYYDKLLNAEGDLRVVREGLYSCCWRLEMIGPDEYVDRVAVFRGLDVDELKRSRCGKKIRRYADAMRRGIEFPVLVLDYSIKNRLSQEGLHRAFAAMAAGVGRFPVLVVRPLPGLF